MTNFFVRYQQYMLSLYFHTQFFIFHNFIRRQIYFFLYIQFSYSLINIKNKQSTSVNLNSSAIITHNIILHPYKQENLNLALLRNYKMILQKAYSTEGIQKDYHFNLADSQKSNTMAQDANDYKNQNKISEYCGNTCKSNKIIIDTTNVPMNTFGSKIQQPNQNINDPQKLKSYFWNSSQQRILQNIQQAKKNTKKPQKILENPMDQRQPDIPQNQQNEQIQCSISFKPKFLQVILGKISKYISSKFSVEMFQCNICAEEVEEKQKRTIGNCEHNFCDSCLKNYVDFKISRFQQVVCPSQHCLITLDKSGQLYSQLSESLKSKYQKVQLFYKTTQNNQRLCPGKKCKDGVLIPGQEGTNPKCNRCNKVFCAKCFFPEHKGLCDLNQVNFLRKSYKYKQCNNCKAIIEKKQGCKHIVCKCKYQFCYICGKSWSHSHFKCREAPRQPIRLPEPSRAVQPQVNPDLEQNCWVNLVKLLAKAFLLFPLFLILICLSLVAFVIHISVLIPYILALGIFSQTCIILKELKSVKVFLALAIVFFPLLVLWGIGQSLFNILGQVLPRYIEVWVDMWTWLFLW